MTATIDFDQLFANHHNRIYRIILNQIQDPVEAEDLTQETLIKAYRGLSSLRTPDCLDAWIARIARNVVVDRHRHGVCRVDDGALSLDDSDLAGAIEETGPLPAQAAEQHLSRKCVRNCIDTLPNSYRQVIELRDLMGLENQEIAERLGLSLATVKIRLHRARLRLRTTFDRHCEVYCDERNELACQPRQAAIE